MGGVPTKHHSKSKVGRRRSQLALKRQGIIPCAKCKAPTMPHRACPSCGFVNKAVRGKKSSSAAKKEN